MTTATKALRELMLAAPEGSQERLAWAKALMAEAFRDRAAPRQFGPPDLRHPMQRIYASLIRSGQPVVFVS